MVRVRGFWLTVLPGHAKKLTLVMKADHPTVRCADPLGPMPQHCEDIIDKMRAGLPRERFHPGPGAGVQLPLTLSSSVLGE